MSEPSPFYRQHHAVEAPAIDTLEFRPYWRIRTRCDQLLIDGAITYPEWRAAQIFRTLAEIILAATWRTKWLDEPHGGNGFDRGLAARHDAMNRLQLIHRHLGAFAFDLLEAHVVNDENWKQLAQRYHVTGPTARNWTVTAIRALAPVMFGSDR